MAKRFTDSNKFKDPWYRKLSPKLKCFWEFLLSECNHAGIVKLDLECASFIIREEVTKEDLKSFSNKLQLIEKDLYFIPNFIEFQYGKLNPSNRVHSSVLKELNKYSLLGASMELISPIEGAKDKDKYKYKDKDKEKNISSLILSSLEAEQHNPEKKNPDQRLYGKYNNVCMSAEQYNRLLGICASQKLLDELVDNLSENIEQGKEHSFRSEFPNTHYIRLQKYYDFRRKNPEKFSNIVQREKNDNWLKEQIKKEDENERLRISWRIKYPFPDKRR